jgi:hypothetical protein
MVVDFSEAMPRRLIYCAVSLFSLASVLIAVLAGQTQGDPDWQTAARGKDGFRGRVRQIEQGF